MEDVDEVIKSERLQRRVLFPQGDNGFFYYQTRGNIGGTLRMISTTRMTSFLCAIALMTIFSGPVCFAFSVTYSLVDSPFNNVSGPYTTNDFISGFFTVDIQGTNSLSDYANLPLIDRASDIIDFSFSDGIKTFTPSDGTFSEGFLFEFATDSSSNIIESDYVIQLGLTQNDIIAPGAGGGQSISGAFNSTPLGFGTNLGEQPGVWAIVPEPSSCTLAILGLLGLCYRRRKR